MFSTDGFCSLSTGAPVSRLRRTLSISATITTHPTLEVHLVLVTSHMTANYAILALQIGEDGEGRQTFYSIPSSQAMPMAVHSAAAAVWIHRE